MTQSLLLGNVEEQLFTIPLYKPSLPLSLFRATAKNNNQMMIARTVMFMLVALTAAVPVWGADHAYDMTIADIVINTSGGTDKTDHNRHDYDILLKAVLTADLAGALSDKNAELTVFAPNDGAFFELAKDLGFKQGYNEVEIFDFLVEALGTLGDPVEVLTNVLLYHVVPGVLTSNAIRQRAKTHEKISTLLEGAVIDPETKGRTIFLHDYDPDLTNPRVIRPHNLKAKNGIIHTINRVLIPIDI